jgi:hypothetical protein
MAILTPSLSTRLLKQIEWENVFILVLDLFALGANIIYETQLTILMLMNLILYNFNLFLTFLIVVLTRLIISNRYQCFRCLKIDFFFRRC